MTPGPSSAKVNADGRSAEDPQSLDAGANVSVKDSDRTDQTRISEGCDALGHGSDECDDTSSNRNPWLQENPLMGTWTQ